MRLETEEVEIDFALGELSESAPLVIRPMPSPSAKGQARIDELLDVLPDTISPARRIHLLQEAARIYVVELQKPEEAIVVLQAALLEDLEYAPVIAKLAELCEQTNSWASLLPELVLVADDKARETPAQAAQIWVQVASWYLAPVNQLNSAEHALDRALELDPSNEAALELRMQLHQQAEDWLAFLHAAKRLLDRGVSPRRKIELLLLCGETAMEKLQDTSLAIEHYRAAHDADPTNRPAIDVLESLYRETDSTASLCRVLWKKAKLLPNKEQQLRIELEVAYLLEHELDNGEQAKRIYARIADLPLALSVLKKQADEAVGLDKAEFFYRMACLLTHRAAPEDTIEWHLQEAISHAPEHERASEQLVERYTAENAWGKAAALYEEKARRSGDRATSVDAKVRAAHIYKDRLDNKARAATLCDEARAALPGLRPAAMLLADIAYEESDFSALSPLVAELLRSEDADGGDGPARLLVMAGACARDEGHLDKAQRYFETALAAEPGHGDALLALGELAQAAGNHPAVVHYGEALLGSGAVSAGKDRARLHFQLAQAQRALGRGDAALAHYAYTLREDPKHPEAHRAELSLREERGEWRAVARAKRESLDATSEAQKATVLAELGDIESRELKSPASALQDYQESLRHEPGNRRVLQRVLDIAAELERWPLANETIIRLAELESDESRKGSFYLASAEICRDKLGDMAQAVGQYELCLDAFFVKPDQVSDEQLRRCMKPFADLDAILTRSKDWKRQELVYRRMIKRLGPGHKLLGSLWHSLAEIYRTRLKDRDAAIAALEVARTLAPESVVGREQLAELYVRAGSDHLDKAIAEHQSIIDIDTHRHTSYSALAELYGETGRQDARWNLCQALTVLDKATSEQQQFFLNNREHAMRLPRGAVPAAMWPRLLHPEHDAKICSLLLLLGAHLLPSTERTPRSRGLKNKEAVAPSEQQDQRLYVLQYFSQVLGLELPTLYVQERRSIGLSSELLVNKGHIQPVLLVGSDYLSMTDESERAFLAGQQLCRLRQENWLSMAFPEPSQTQAMLDWILSGTECRDHPVLAKLLDQVRVQNPVVLEQLRVISDRITSEGTPPDAVRWHHGQVKTCDRAGLILSSDLTSGARGIVRDACGATMERVAELVRFSVSEPYFQMREAMR